MSFLVDALGSPNCQIVKSARRRGARVANLTLDLLIEVKIGGSNEQDDV
jgi:hypothetical protein